MDQQGSADRPYALAADILAGLPVLSSCRPMRLRLGRLPHYLTRMAACAAVYPFRVTCLARCWATVPTVAVGQCVPLHVLFTRTTGATLAGAVWEHKARWFDIGFWPGDLSS